MPLCWRFLRCLFLEGLLSCARHPDSTEGRLSRRVVQDAALAPNSECVPLAEALEMNSLSQLSALLGAMVRVLRELMSLGRCSR